MQRPTYSMPPAQSPPLHHPVPQHVSTVPQLRSPPPPTSQNSYGYGQQSPAQGQQGNAGGSGNFVHPAFGGFMDDPTAKMAMGFGTQALGVGQQYLDKSVSLAGLADIRGADGQSAANVDISQFNRYVNVSALKHYFNVSNAYVVNKLFVVLFPWRHRPWSRQVSHVSHPGNGNGSSAASFLPPREDINSPDMYIPVMAFTTYVLLSTLIAGLNGKFKPELLGITFSNASVIITLELALLWLGRYFLNINSESQIYDLIAYSGYKFVGIIVTIAVAAIFNGGKGSVNWIGWAAFAYTFMANAFFLVRGYETPWYMCLTEDGSSGL